jgi:hypothetical protein
MDSDLFIWLIGAFTVEYTSRRLRGGQLFVVGFIGRGQLLILPGSVALSSTPR